MFEQKKIVFLIFFYFSITLDGHRTDDPIVNDVYDIKKQCESYKEHFSGAIPSMGYDEVVLVANGHPAKNDFCHIINEFKDYNCTQNAFQIFQMRAALFDKMKGLNEHYIAELKKHYTLENQKTLDALQKFQENLKKVDAVLDQLNDFRNETYQNFAEVLKIIGEGFSKIEALTEQSRRQIEEVRKLTAKGFENVTEQIQEFRAAFDKMYVEGIRLITDQIHNATGVIVDKMNGLQGNLDMLQLTLTNDNERKEYQDFFTNQKDLNEKIFRVVQLAFKHARYEGSIDASPNVREYLKRDFLSLFRDYKVETEIINWITQHIYIQSSYYTILPAKIDFMSWKERIVMARELSIKLLRSFYNHEASTGLYLNLEEAKELAIMVENDIRKNFIDDHLIKSKTIKDLQYGQFWLRSFKKPIVINEFFSVNGNPSVNVSENVFRLAPVQREQTYQYPIQSYLEQAQTRAAVKEALNSFDVNLVDFKVSPSVSHLYLMEQSNSVDSFYLPSVDDFVTNTIKKKKDIPYHIFACCNETTQICKTDACNPCEIKHVSFCPGLSIWFDPKTKSFTKWWPKWKYQEDDWFQNCTTVALASPSQNAPSVGFCFNGIQDYTNNLEERTNAMRTVMREVEMETKTTQTWYWKILFSHNLGCWWNEDKNFRGECCPIESIKLKTKIVGEPFQRLYPVTSHSECWKYCSNMPACLGAQVQENGLNRPIIGQCHLFKRVLEKHETTEKYTSIIMNVHNKEITTDDERKFCETVE